MPLAGSAILMAAGIAGAIAPTDPIDTVAGTGTAGYGGDGSAATAARLSYPSAVEALTGDGVLVADRANHRIREVDADGIIRTVAGGGVSWGDGQATSIRLSHPWGVDRGADGTIYIADRNRHRVVKVDAGGNLTTVAGTGGAAGFSGDGGPATAARLRYPNDVVVGSDGSLYISDRNNHRIRKVSSDGTISTVAGNGSRGFGGDGGPATAARLQYPEDLDLDDEGNLYIADRNNHRVRRVAGGEIRTVAGGGPSTGDGQATSVRLRFPTGVDWVPGGTIYVADRGQQRVRKVTPDGQMTTVVGTGAAGFGGDGGPAGSARLRNPEDVSLSGRGDLYIADSGNHRIRVIANALPAAVLSAAPTDGTVPLTVAFSAAGSLDPNSQVISHVWDFGDGASASGLTPTHTYTSTGTFAVTLTVTDDSGAQVTATGSITVSEPPPAPPPPAAPTGTPMVPSDPPTCHGRPATIVGTAADDVIVGTPGDDVIVALDGDDTVWSLSGNDTVCLGSGDDRLAAGPGGDLGIGGAGDDLLRGGPGSDGLAGGPGDDRLAGHGGGDTLKGGPGADLLGGGVGRDQSHGGAGPDRIYSGPGSDASYGGAGDDTLFGHDGDDRLQGDAGADRAFGGNGRDLVLGGSGDDTLVGGRFNDQLSGGGGNDVLYGEHGRDRLFGSSGRDLADGGRGRDVCRAEIKRSC